MIVKLQKDKNNVEDKYDRLEKKYADLSVMISLMRLFLFLA